jgi:hypothetical protein
MSEHIEDERISTKEAYKAMFLFLDFYWKLGNKKSDELAGLLGDLALLSDGSSADPALLDDWAECVREEINYRGKPDDGPWILDMHKS